MTIPANLERINVKSAETYREDAKNAVRQVVQLITGKSTNTRENESWQTIAHWASVHSDTTVTANAEKITAVLSNTVFVGEMWGFVAGRPPHRPAFYADVNKLIDAVNMLLNTYRRTHPMPIEYVEEEKRAFLSSLSYPPAPSPLQLSSSSLSALPLADSSLSTPSPSFRTSPPASPPFYSPNHSPLLFSSSPSRHLAFPSPLSFPASSLSEPSLPFSLSSPSQALFSTSSPSLPSQRPSTAPPSTTPPEKPADKSLWSSFIDTVEERFESLFRL